MNQNAASATWLFRWLSLCLGGMVKGKKKGGGGIKIRCLSSVHSNVWISRTTSPASNIRHTWVFLSDVHSLKRATQRRAHLFWQVYNGGRNYIFPSFIAKRSLIFYDECEWMRRQWVHRPLSSSQGPGFLSSNGSKAPVQPHVKPLLCLIMCFSACFR